LGTMQCCTKGSISSIIHVDSPVKTSRLSEVSKEVVFKGIMTGQSTCMCICRDHNLHKITSNENSSHIHKGINWNPVEHLGISLLDKYWSILYVREVSGGEWGYNLVELWLVNMMYTVYMAMYIATCFVTVTYNYGSLGRRFSCLSNNIEYSVFAAIRKFPQIEIGTLHNTR